VSSTVKKSINADIDRKFKLRDLLVLRIQDKFRHRFNAAMAGDQVAWVSQAVEELVFTKSSAPAEADLNRILAAIPGAPERKTSTPAPRISTSAMSNQSFAASNRNDNSTANFEQQQQQQQRSMHEYVEDDARAHGYSRTLGGADSPVSVTSSTMRRNKDAWAAILEKDVEKYREEQRLMAQRREEAKRKAKQALDVQVSEKTHKVEDAKHYDEMYVEIEKKQVDDWRKTEEDKIRRQKERDLEVKKMLDEQLQAVQSKRVTEKDRQRRAEEIELVRIQEQLQREAEAERRKKEVKKEEFKRAMEFNVRVQEEKGKRAQEEAEYELRLQKEYASRLEAQERARTEAFEKTYARQQRNMALNMAVQDNIAAKAREDEMRAERQQREIFERQDRIEAERRAKRMSEKESMKQMLAKQLEMQERAKQLEQDEERRMGEQLRRIGLEEEERKRQVAEARKRQMQKNKTEYGKQLEEARRLKKEFTMTETEKRINKKLLEGVEVDEDEQQL
jgi:hypothetical protein